MKIHIITKEVQHKTMLGKTFQELSTIYSHILFRDFDLINEATISNSEAFMESVTAHIFARKIPLHSPINPLFYMPTGLTVLDAIIYLEPNKFPYIESIYRNNEKVPFHALLNTNDIITYTLGNTITVTQGAKKDIQSGISQWRIEQLHNTL
jgi:(p)ppGpp synthase/HD superfamily hydrolase